GDEEQNAQHQEQLNADQKHSDAHSCFHRNVVAGIRLAPEACKGGARVCERVHADSEPSNGITSSYSNQTENQNDDNSVEFKMLKKTEVKDDRSADEDFQDHQEPALCLKICLAGLVNEFGDFPHRGMNRQVLEFSVDVQPEDQAKRGDDETSTQK